MGKIPIKSKKVPHKSRKPAWFKASQDDKDQYTSDLHERLCNLDQPVSLDCQNPNCKDASHTQDRDSYVLDILTSVIESSHSCIPLTGGSRGSFSPDPSRSCPVKEGVPGWKDEVEPQRQESLFWHAVWRSAGSPKEGPLHHSMKTSRNLYHYLIRKVKKRSEVIRAQKLLEASENGSTDLLREMKKVRGGSKIKNELTEDLEGANGEDNIAEKFCSVYEELYNSSPSGEALKALKDTVADELENNNEQAMSEIMKITGQVVKDAASKLKAGKQDVSEGYTSDAILNAPDILFIQLAGVYRSWLHHETVSLNLLACAFLPLLRSSVKNPAEANSYRAIAGSSLLLKLLDQVILQLWEHLLTSDSLQFGYKTGFSTTQCTWLVVEVASYFLRKGTPCIVTLLDCTKAFDKCKFDILFGKLVERGLPAVVTRVLLYVYEEQQAWVRWGESRSRIFSVVNGTRQGSVLSPARFSVYMDDLIARLRKSGVGCHIGGVFCGVVGYADDLLLMAPSRSAMETMLGLCEEYAAENNLEFSTDPNPVKSKSKCIFMSGHLRRPEPANLKLYGVDLPWVKKATHLGHEISSDCMMIEDMKCKRGSFISRSTEIRETFKFAQPNQILQAVQTYCLDMYGAMAWPLYSEKAKQVFNSWSTCVKLAWGVPRATRTYLVDNLLSAGIPSVRACVLARYCKFLFSLRSSPSMEVRVVANLAGADIRSITGSNVHNIEMEAGQKLNEDNLGKLRQTLLNTKTEVPSKDTWRIACLRKFLSERYEMKSKCQETEQVQILIDSLCTS